MGGYTASREPSAPVLTRKLRPRLCAIGDDDLERVKNGGHVCGSGSEVGLERSDPQVAKRCRREGRIWLREELPESGSNGRRAHKADRASDRPRDDRSKSAALRAFPCCGPGMKAGHKRWPHMVREAQRALSQRLPALHAPLARVGVADRAFGPRKSRTTGGLGMTRGGRGSRPAHHPTSRSYRRRQRV